MIYLDSNIFIYALVNDPTDEKNKQSRKVIERVVYGKKKGYTSILTWDEVFYNIKKRFGTEIAIKRTEKILAMPNLIWLKTDKNIIETAMGLSKEFDPRDAIHLATAIHNGIKTFVSDDNDFSKTDLVKHQKLN